MESRMRNTDVVVWLEKRPRVDVVIVAGNARVLFTATHYAATENDGIVLSDAAKSISATFTVSPTSRAWYTADDLAIVDDTLVHSISFLGV